MKNIMAFSNKQCKHSQCKKDAIKEGHCRRHRIEFLDELIDRIREVRQNIKRSHLSG